MGNRHSALSILFVALAIANTANAADTANTPDIADTSATANTAGGANSAGGQLDEIVVTATLRSVSLEELPGSVSVLTSAALRDAGQQHFEDVLPLVPNLNWAGDTSRPRYFQIRGIGELQQYQGAPNPSVGFLIDDIDFSGLGSAATLFDVDRIEVLRGLKAPCMAPMRSRG